jgi:alkylation response protein AidB-like acyl-CoA dehydrogenase
MADMHVLVETAESASLAAATAVVTGVDLPTTAATASVWCTEAFATVAGEMIQLHGGIAITWEHDAHLYFKRAHGNTHLFGSPREHVARLGAELGQ